MINPLVSFLRLFQRSRRFAVLLVVIFIASLILLRQFIDNDDTNESIHKLNNMIKQWNMNLDTNTVMDSDISQITLDPSSSSKPKAVLLMFARNMDLASVMETVRTFEERFNRKYEYDWVFISDIPYTPIFVQMTTSLVTANVKHITVDKNEFMANPKDLNGRKIKAVKSAMKKNGIKEKFSMKAKLIDQFWTANIFRVAELNEYDYFMRITPGVEVHCDITYDPFQFMSNSGKTYGFGIATINQPNVFETLWPETLKYITEHPRIVNPNNLIEFISDDKGMSYNGCQLASTFEIGSLRFFKSSKYLTFVDHLLELKGMYYENWSGAALRTLAVILLEDRRRLQFFNNLGLSLISKEQSMNLCPYETGSRLQGKCTCDPLKDQTWLENSCVEKFYQSHGVKIPIYADELRAKIAMAEEANNERSQKEKLEQEALTKDRMIQEKIDVDQVVN